MNCTVLKIADYETLSSTICVSTALRCIIPGILPPKSRRLFERTTQRSVKQTHRKRPVTSIGLLNVIEPIKRQSLTRLLRRISIAFTLFSTLSEARELGIGHFQKHQQTKNAPVFLKQPPYRILCPIPLKSCQNIALVPNHITTGNNKLTQFKAQLKMQIMYCVCIV